MKCNDKLTLAERVDQFVKQLEESWDLRLKDKLTAAARTQTNNLCSPAMRYANALQNEAENRFKNLVAIFEHEAKAEPDFNVNDVLTSYDVRAGQMFRPVWECGTKVLTTDLVGYEHAHKTYHANVQASVRWTNAELQLALIKIWDEKKQQRLTEEATIAQKDAAVSGKRTAKWTLWLVVVGFLSFLLTSLPEFHKKDDQLSAHSEARQIRSTSAISQSMEESCQSSNPCPPCIWEGETDDSRFPWK
jgi:hypothetical protein